MATLVLTRTPRRHGLGVGGVSGEVREGRRRERPETAAGRGHHGQARLAGGGERWREGARGGGMGRSTTISGGAGEESWQGPGTACLFIWEAEAR